MSLPWPDWSPAEWRRRLKMAPSTLGDYEGHPFHGNQYTGGSSLRAEQSLASGGLATGFREALSGPEEVHLAQNLDVLRGAASRMDFPAEKVTIASYDRGFSVGGRQFAEGGHFDNGTGELVLRAETLARVSSQDAEAMLAHEVAHRDWHDVSDVLGLEAGGMPGVEKFDDPTIQAHADAVRSIYFEQGAELEKEDGVSPYSRAYWDEVPKETVLVPYDDKETPWLNPNTGELYKDKPHIEFDPNDEYDEKFRAAVNETLAEIRERDLQRAFGTFEKEHYDPTPRWRALHDSVADLAKALRARKKVTA